MLCTSYCILAHPWHHLHFTDPDTEAKGAEVAAWELRAFRGKSERGFSRNIATVPLSLAKVSQSSVTSHSFLLAYRGQIP